MSKSIFTLVLLIVALLGALKIQSFVKNNTPEPVTSPSPIVTESPTPNIGTTTSIVVLSLDQPFNVFGTMITIPSIIEDSRCPQDVQCIQAGNVRVEINIVDPTGTTTATNMLLGESLVTENLIITLDEVTPYPISTYEILPVEYRFKLGITNK